MCERSLCKKSCNNCFALCFERPGAALLLGEYELEIKQNTSIDLPIHIPIIPDALKQMPDYRLMPCIAVHAGNMFSRDGERIYPKYKNMGCQGALNVDPRTKILLEFYVRDKTIEGFWDKRKELYNDLKKLNFDSVIAPNYSVFEDAPRLDHLYNIKRSKTVYSELMDIGINAIPDVSWFNIRDLENWCQEIERSGIKLIAFSFQVVDVGLKTANLWRLSLTGFRYLCQNLSQDVSIIIAGVVSPFRLNDVYAAASGRTLHILNQSAYVQSRRGMLSEIRESCKECTLDEIFIRNLKYFNSLYDEMNKSTTISEVIAWEKSQLTDFYIAYKRSREDLQKKYANLDLLYSVVLRQMKKKKILKGGVKCLNHEETVLPELDPETKTAVQE